jgi:Flp pilus assembly pilin Flp
VGYGLVLVLITMALLIAVRSQALVSALANLITRVQACFSAVACG